MAAAYSSYGQTRVVYAASFTPDILVLMFRFTKPRIVLPVPVILSMCEPQDRLLEMSTARYLAQVTVSRTTPCCCCCCFIVELPRLFIRGIRQDFKFYVLPSPHPNDRTTYCSQPTVILTYLLYSNHSGFPSP